MTVRRGSQSPYGSDPRSQMPPRGMMGDMGEMDMAIREVGREAGYGNSMAGDLEDYRTHDARSRQSHSMRNSMDLRDGGSMEERVRRTNLAVSLANSQIGPDALSAEVHPKMTQDGRFPSEFRSGMTLNELRAMIQSDSRVLDNLLDAYDLRDELRQIPMSSRDPYGSDAVGKLKMSILFDYLGLSKVAHLLRAKSQNMTGSMAPMRY